MASTEGGIAGLTPIELEAARGHLPDWARATPERRAHMARVAAVLEEWAYAIGLEEAEVLRWAAAGWLHDVLRDADPAELIPDVTSSERGLPGKVLHGPAAAARLHGLVHPSVESAVRYHTLGHPSLDRLGRALYLADYLEPGRRFADDVRAVQRRRWPTEPDAVLVEVLAARIGNILDARRPIHPETAAFWTDAVTRRGA